MIRPVRNVSAAQWGFGAAFLLAIPLASCAGGGAGSTAGTPVSAGSGGSTVPSSYVRPKFVIGPPSANASSARRSPRYIDYGAKGITITLESVNGTPMTASATTDLVTTNCSAGCTVLGPPVPPGTDQFGVAMYDAEPTGSPLAEPANANALAISNSSASPAAPDPTFTIVPATSNSVSILLYGVPNHFTATSAPGLNTFAANTVYPNPTANPTTPAYPLQIAVLDALGNAITGQFSQPVTVKDNDPNPYSSTNPFGTSISLASAAPPANKTVTLNSSSDEANVSTVYGGIAELAPTFTISATGATPIPAAQPYAITLNPIVLASPNLQLYNGGPATATSGISEAGWSNAPYGEGFAVGTSTCSGQGAAAGVPAVKITGSKKAVATFTAPVPSPSPFSCTNPITELAGTSPAVVAPGQTGTLTYTYTTTQFVIPSPTPT